MQMGFVSALKEAQDTVAGKRKRAFFVSQLKVWSQTSSPRLAWELAGHEPQPHPELVTSTLTFNKVPGNSRAH